jgi:hypothetical protein
MKAFDVYQLGTGGPQRYSECADEEKFPFLLQRSKYTVISKYQQIKDALTKCTQLDRSAVADRAITSPLQSLYMISKE